MQRFSIYFIPWNYAMIYINIQIKKSYELFVICCLLFAVLPLLQWYLMLISVICYALMRAPKFEIFDITGCILIIGKPSLFAIFQ